MANDHPEMDEAERDAFLSTGGTGVISFAAGEEEAPYSVPMSYGYDEAAEAFYFRLAVDADAAERRPTNRPVTFVTFGQDAAGAWRSVVVTGRLREVTEPAISMDSLAGLRRIHIPLVEVFDAPTDAVEFEFYRLSPDAFTTRAE